MDRQTPRPRDSEDQVAPVTINHVHLKNLKMGTLWTLSIPNGSRPGASRPGPCLSGLLYRQSWIDQRERLQFKGEVALGEETRLPSYLCGDGSWGSAVEGREAGGLVSVEAQKKECCPGPGEQGLFWDVFGKLQPLIMTSQNLLLACQSLTVMIHGGSEAAQGSNYQFTAADVSAGSVITESFLSGRNQCRYFQEF